MKPKVPSHTHQVLHYLKLARLVLHCLCIPTKVLHIHKGILLGLTQIESAN